MRTVALLFILLAYSPVHAGMHKFSNKALHTKLGIDVPGYDLTFKGEDREIKFNPNVRALYSVGVSLQDFLGVNWGFRASQTEKEELKKGETDYDDWRINLAFHQFHLFLNYSQFKGFYIEDSHEVDNTWTSDLPYVQAPNLSSRTAGANFTWVVSPENYSLIAAMDQTERQEKSGGSFLLGAAATETVFRDSDEIIPASVQSAYGRDATLTEGRFMALSAKGGYGYTLVFNDKYFASLAVQIGYGTQRMSLKGTNFDRTAWAQATKVDGLLSLGWNGDDYYSGISVSGDGTTFDTGPIDITTTLYAIKLYFGFRI
jgi:hypothetical protein